MPRHPSLLFLPATALLVACSITPQEPVVSSFNGDSVSIVQPVFAAFTDEELQARALDICQRGGSGQTVERVSARALPDLQGTEYLFLCLD